MSRNTSSNNGAAGCGYLIILALIGAVVIALLPYILMGAAACFTVWLLVRFHREAWMILQWISDLLAWITVGALMVARWILTQAGDWIARRCQQPLASMTGSSVLSPPPAQIPQPSSNTSPARIHPGWKLKNQDRPP